MQKITITDWVVFALQRELDVEIAMTRYIGFKTVFVEIHDKDCKCTYCVDFAMSKKLKYGLNIPTDWKAPNAWWVIKLWPQVYFRWINSWLRKTQQSE